MNDVVSDLRPELTRPIPTRIAGLARARGYPVPWFVAWYGPGGGLVEAGTPGAVPEFRAMVGEKWRRAVQERLCWVCGDRLGKFMTFVAGPMCGVNRTSAEPPCHKECAEWSARNCPFLSRPHMVRRDNDLPEIDPAHQAGFMIARNPGVTLLWTTRSYSLFDDGKGQALIEMGPADSVTWWRAGRAATRAEVEESVRTGLPALEKLAGCEDGAMADLALRVKALEALYPRI